MMGCFISSFLSQTNLVAFIEGFSSPEKRIEIRTETGGRRGESVMGCVYLEEWANPFESVRANEMNGIQNRRANNLDKSFPGCTGRVVNLFDFGPAMTRNKLLTGKPHNDVVKKASDQFGYPLENKQIKHEFTTNSISNGTPMKMLIAQEMSKETESKHKPPGVVAKLMGLDALPGQQPMSTPVKGQPQGCTFNAPIRTGMSPGYLHHESDIHHFKDPEEYKDVYEVWLPSPKAHSIKDRSPQKGVYEEKPSQTRMSLVREKFIEAKRLATDEKLRQSKEFADALEVLSSNKELFLKFLQEPNSLFSQHLYEMQSLPHLPETRRITVLRPSKTMENNRFVEPKKMNQKHRRSQSQEIEANVWDRTIQKSSSFTNQNNDNLTEPTRIVVLKPSPGKINDIKAVTCPSSPSLIHGKEFFEELENGEAQCSREVAKEITRIMCENLGRYQKEETMLSSVLSNGYNGDESSFNRSDNEYTGEGNLTDSEVMTPSSRHSWDYVNRFPSQCSSSFSRASFSPESSVCREAKKRLSERWAMMASTGNCQEQRQLRRSSSTLGEMLALSDTNKSARSTGEEIAQVCVSSSRSCGGEQELRYPTSSCSSNSKETDEVKEGNSPRNLLRSKSVPVSSTAYGARMHVEVSEAEDGNLATTPKEIEKSKSGKLSFRGKFSSLFFSKTKKSKENPAMSSLSGLGDEVRSAISEPQRDSKHPEIGEDISQCSTTCGFEEGSPLSPKKSSNKTPSLAPVCVAPEQRNSSHEAGMKTVMLGSQSENHEQPSPLSVLDAPFEDDDTVAQSSSGVKLDCQGQPAHLQSLKSNLISKSPPIESLARSLSWDDACSDDSATPGQLKFLRVSSEAEEEQEWLLFIQKLLSSLSSESGKHNNASFTRWHSPESPLDPLLIDDEYVIGLKDDKLRRSDVKRRQRRSNKKLIFDCVNAALVDSMGHGFNAGQCCRTSSQVTAEEVWNRVRDWFSGDAKYFTGESGGEGNSQVVENVVRKEVVGKGWVAFMRLEVDGIHKEIEGKVLEELVEEALVELTIGTRAHSNYPRTLTRRSSCPI